MLASSALYYESAHGYVQYVSPWMGLFYTCQNDSFRLLYLNEMNSLSDLTLTTFQLLYLI